MYLEITLENLSNFILDKNSQKSVPHKNYSNRDFMNALIIFQELLMHKVYEIQNYDKMDCEDRVKMTEQCGKDLRKLIHTYTNLDTHKIEDFI